MHRISSLADPVAQCLNAPPRCVLQRYPKTNNELRRIENAVKTNFLFQHLSRSQRLAVFAAMEHYPCAAGDVIIKQGDEGDRFYVVDSGEYDVFVKHVGQQKAAAHVMTYHTQTGHNPCFGELALLYSQPRAATVKCKVSGTLWALERKAFRSVLMKTAAKTLIQVWKFFGVKKCWTGVHSVSPLFYCIYKLLSLSRQLFAWLIWLTNTYPHTRLLLVLVAAPFAKVLRKVEILKSLNSKQIRRLADVLTEETFGDGNYIVRQGDVGNSFYIIRDGNAVVTLKDDLTDAAEIPREVMRLSENQYFGERALLRCEPRAASVLAVGSVKCLCV